MPKAKIFTDKEARFLKELVKHRVAFMIVGLSAATLQGAPVVTQGIDLWFKDLSDPNFQRALKKVGGTYMPPAALHPPALAGGDLELFDIVLNMDGLGKFSNEIKNTVDVPLGRYKIKVLSLERTIQSKEAAGRPKDKLTLKVLKDTLKVLGSSSKKRAHR